MAQEDDKLRSRLVDLRESRNLSQSELAKRLGFDNSIISKIEGGSRRVSATELSKFADFFGVTADYLLGNHQTPEWATESDIIDMKVFLNSNVNMAFGGVTLDSKQKKRVDEILTQIYWDELQKEKKRKSQEGNTNE